MALFAGQEKHSSVEEGGGGVERAEKRKVKQEKHRDKDNDKSAFIVVIIIIQKASLSLCSLCFFSLILKFALVAKWVSESVVL